MVTGGAAPLQAVRQPPDPSISLSMKPSSTVDSLDWTMIPVMKMVWEPQERNGVISGYSLRVKRVSDEENPFLTKTKSK